MKFHAILMSTLFCSTTALADSVTCTLSSGTEKASATFEVSSNSEDYVISDGVYDLSFNFNVGCEDKDCSVGITIDSGILEDEAGSTSFDFKREGEAREIFSEPVTDAPDKRDYYLSCNYQP